MPPPRPRTDANVPFWRTFAVLGRVSNLPTVWSNCLAGWLLGGGGDWGRWWALALGATAVYLGGMFLNDAFDAEFDRRHRPTRPIPSDAVAETRVWQWGFGLLAFGTTVMALPGRVPATFSLLLAATVLAYNAVHKRTPLAVGLMAGCRLLLYLIAASVAAGHVGGLALWAGLALALYVAGLSLIARREALPGPRPWWPAVLLAAPLVLAWFANDARAWERAVAISLLLVLWVLPFLHHLFRHPAANPAFTVAGLLAGIVIVDCLAVAGGPPALVPVFGALFALALLAQRYLPAT